MWTRLLLPLWLNDWVRTLAAETCLPCRVQRRWAFGTQLLASPLLEFNLKPCWHRCCQITKLSWQLSCQPEKNSGNASWGGNGNTFTIHRIQNCKLQRQTENHGWGRDCLGGWGLWFFPANQDQECKQRHRDVLRNWCWWYSRRLECQMECSDTRWVIIILGICCLMSFASKELIANTDTSGKPHVRNVVLSSRITSIPAAENGFLFTFLNLFSNT